MVKELKLDGSVSIILSPRLRRVREVNDPINVGIEVR
jgi:hypothetical protein